MSQHEVDEDKVQRIVVHLRAGGTVPPVVVALYGTRALPLDGPHCILAQERLNLLVDAWMVPGRSFDRLCTLQSDAEAHTPAC